MKIDPKIDELYQLPLEQFTERRNALAKEVSGTSKKQVRFLSKPPLPIWAVNQLYWNHRATYNALIDASERLRAAHKAVLSGHKADLRKPEQVHRAALETAVAKTIALLDTSHGTVSDSARETVRKALDGLPNEEAPGRLTRAPEAAGFSLLTGITPRDVKAEREPKKRTAEPPERASRVATRANAAKARAERMREERATRAREEALALAERDVQRSRKAAEQAIFNVRTLAADLQRAQAAEEKVAEQLTLAEERLARLRTAPL